jgi:hypothetical protein
MELLTDLVTIVPIISMLCSVVASLTPTPKDDEWVAKWYKIIDVLAVNIGKAKK